MKFQRLLPLAVIGGAFVSVGSIASAAITLQDSGGIAKTQGAAGSITVTSAELGDFNANGTDKLIVTVSGERGGAGSYGHAGVTYGSVAMIQIFSTTTDNAARNISMWYLDNVSVTGDFEVDFTGNGSGVGLAAVALNGTTAGFTASNFSTNGTSTTIPAVSGQFVMALGMNNNSSTPPTASSPLAQLFSGDTGSSGGAAGYQFVTTDGTTTPTFSGASGVGAASFTAIPEPTAALLGGVGALLLLRRRRN